MSEAWDNPGYGSGRGSPADRSGRADVQRVPDPQTSVGLGRRPHRGPRGDVRCRGDAPASRARRGAEPGGWRSLDRHRRGSGGVDDLGRLHRRCPARCRGVQRPCPRPLVPLSPTVRSSSLTWSVSKPSNTDRSGSTAAGGSAGRNADVPTACPATGVSSCPCTTGARFSSERTMPIALPAPFALNPPALSAERGRRWRAL